ncbi:beta-N-acetylhexosaminidase [Aureibaculum algae]|uniref:beta-N-acetylhexosaminidase n=1 Tax=Aureibaculum algae TaxID=2584122 RepID=A0A5B7TPD7_9FLAO|nr:beta-N-acetylhexosaminidase [Aureibaculum algae]QCX38605.1 beta-N-acetylhexosaminidase [Aureibaculum algae]
MKKFFYLILAIFPFLGYAQIIPAPTSIEPQQGTFTLDNKTGFKLNGIDTSDSILLTDYLSSIVEEETSVAISRTANNTKNIVFELTKNSINALETESYELNINESEIRIKANSKAGLFYGMQSLLQYIFNYNTQTPIQLPCVAITDKPNVKWRGMLLDVSRHFYTVNTVKVVLDLMAFYKLNVFHWHLADNEGWRLEIKKYPKLTSVGAWRKEIPGSIFYKPDSTYTKKLDGKPYTYGGFYTQKQIKEIVKYAADRNITVIPEIDVPGHSAAALTAYPEFSCEKHEQEAPNSSLWNGVTDTDKINISYCAGQESTFFFLENVFTEVMELFPSEYIHVGGDEVDKSYWAKCSNCQARIKKEGLKDEHELQSYFIKRMAKFLEKHNRKLIGWDEILEGGAPTNATIMSWRGEKGGIAAAKMEKEVIMSPNNRLYFDMPQTDSKDEPYGPTYGINTLETVYNYNIYPKELLPKEKAYIKGGQFAIWTEFIASVEHLEYMLLPRMPAFAENLWSTPENKDFNSFIIRLNQGHYNYWKRNGIRFHTKFYEKEINE